MMAADVLFRQAQIAIGSATNDEFVSSQDDLVSQGVAATFSNPDPRSHDRAIIGRKE
jgi:hypothetical protein